MSAPQPLPQTSGEFSPDGKTGSVSKSISFSGGTATVLADGIWENVYQNGVPAEGNAWKSSQIRISDDNCVTETLSNRTIIRYDTNGAFSSGTSPEGVTLTKDQLGIEVVPAKSTRIVRTFDARGNEVRTEKHVHTGEVFELISWENKTYAPTHKVISTERSDGKTSSADYIYTGALWTIDENGVRTDNTFDAAKRLKTSTRRGARGDVVTTYGYDSQGRRFEKKVTVAGTTTLHHRYIYRGYLQIAALDLTRAAHPALWLVTWDPTQPTATRPLAIQKDGTWFTYGYDITKNVCEVFGPAGYIRTAYAYAPFGAVSASGDVTQPFQWSSEFYDSELDLVYYNYRHYSPSLGRFLSRDPIEEQGGWNLYLAFRNSPKQYFDFGGLESNFYRMIKLASKASLIETTKEIALSCLKEILGDVYQEATLVSSLKALCGEAGVNPRGSSHWSKLPITIDLESELKKSTYDMIVDALVSSVLAILNDAKEVKRFRSLLEKLSVKHLDKEFSKVEKVALAGAISSEIANEIKEEFQLETKNYIRITKLNRKSCQIRYRTKIDFRLSYAGMFSTFSSESGDSVLGDLPAQLKNACGCCKK